MLWVWEELSKCLEEMLVDILDLSVWSRHIKMPVNTVGLGDRVNTPL